MCDNKVSNRQNFVVCLKNVPPTLHKEELEKICCRLGHIEHINMNKQPFVFIKVASQSDLENVILGLKKNSYGIIAEPAKCSAQPRHGENQDNDRVQRFKQNICLKKSEDDRRLSKNDDHRAMNKIEDCIEGTSETTNTKTDERGLCKVCKKISQNVCQRCGDFYCSLKCQRADWEKHRYICFPLPKLVVPSSLRTDSVPEVQPNVSQLNCEVTDCRSETLHSKHKEIPIDLKEAASFSVNNKYISRVKQNEPADKTQNKTSIPCFGNQAEKCIPKIPPNGTKVVLTSVKTSNQVYIRSLEKVENENYMNILCKINSEGKTARKLVKSPNVGDIVITDFMKTGHYRAAVTKVENQNIEVFYIDFGNKEKKQLEDLREMPATLLNTQQFIYEITLKKVPSFPLTEKARAFVDKYVDNLKELKLIYAALPEQDGFELFDIVDNTNFNEKIMQFKNHVENIDFRQIPVTINDIKVNLLPTGENVPVFISDNSLAETNMISCINKSFLGKLDELNNELNVYAESIKETYSPKESEVVLALFDDDQKWYRAECLEYEGKDHVSVMFIDFGNFATVNVKNIKKYPHQLVRPCYTSSCVIFDLPDELSEKAANKLRELVPSNGIAVIDKVEADESNLVNIIHMPKVVAALKEENLL